MIEQVRLQYFLHSDLFLSFPSNYTYEISNGNVRKGCYIFFEG